MTTNLLELWLVKKKKAKTAKAIHKKSAKTKTDETVASCLKEEGIQEL